jgi:hypothetical protein
LFQATKIRFRFFVTSSKQKRLSSTVGRSFSGACPTKSCKCWFTDICNGKPNDEVLLPTYRKNVFLERVIETFYPKTSIKVSARFSTITIGIIYINVMLFRKCLLFRI